MVNSSFEFIKHIDVLYILSILIRSSVFGNRMDRGWMYDIDRISDEFQNKLESFLDFAINKASSGGLINCPCYDCIGRRLLTREEVGFHITKYGFQTNYYVWYHNGEKRQSKSVDDHNGRTRMEDFLFDRFPFIHHHEEESMPVQGENHDGTNSAWGKDGNDERVKNLMADAKTPVYRQCGKMTKLEFLMRLFHGKTMYGISNTAIDYILQLLKDLLPDDADIPSNHYMASKLIDQLGFSSNKIHACPKDCSLFWEETKGLNECKVCGTSRWKPKADGTPSSVPQKVVWHFPLIPRLQNLFMSEETATDMRWHDTNRIKDNDELVHPADGLAWKKFDARYPEFANEVRNVRLGLSCDGFNPFGHMLTSHSTWPIFIHIYNLPPWMCMKKPFTFLSILISGPSDPGNDIDVYMQPLINELNQLWNEGVRTYDASLKEVFQMRAALMWTINDFPAYAMMSGWSTKGKLSCPICMKDTRSRRLKYRRTFSFVGHRRFLPMDHAYRKQRRRFDNTVETEMPPKRMSGIDVLNELRDLNFHIGKGKENGKKRKNVSIECKHNWRKKSILFDLPYWSSNLLRHCLDVMHIEKNICEMLLSTILNIKGKTRDDIRSRRDLVDWGIRPELHPISIGENKWKVPYASYVLTPLEKIQFLEVLETIKVPDGYSSNISKRVNRRELKLKSLKTHDYHILLHELIPIAIRNLLSNNVRATVMRLCYFYRDLCAKRLSKSFLKKMQVEAPLILCDLEKIFPPSFFTCMLHLTVHLPTEILLGGPVAFRWMYPTERNMFTMKSYVRNKNHPEGSIVKGYLGQECMNFCSMYLGDVITRRNQPMKNDEDLYEKVEPVFPSLPQPAGIIGPYKLVTLSVEEREMAHRTVLFNCDLFDDYIKEHRQMIIRSHRSLPLRRREHLHSKEFPMWLKSKVQTLPVESVYEEIRALAFGPNSVVRECKALVINGYKFVITDRAINMSTQHDGVMLSATTDCFSSASDKRPRSENVSYYGLVDKIQILDYYSHGRVVMMKCKWYDTMTRHGTFIDDNGFRLIDTTRFLNSDEPYIFASMAKQVFYVKDHVRPAFSVINGVVPRHLFDDSGDEASTVDASLDIEKYIVCDDSNTEIVRLDHEAEVVEGNI